jgi:hypothetical protein
MQQIFTNLSHVFVFMNNPEYVYFDDVDSEIKICLPIAD